MTVESLMEALHRVEEAFGRRRGEANAPRTLDLDLIAFGRRVGEAPVTPHPRAHQRMFVTAPLRKIAPGWVHPGLGKRIDVLDRQAAFGRDAVPLQSKLKQFGFLYWNGTWARGAIGAVIAGVGLISVIWRALTGDINPWEALGFSALFLAGLAWMGFASLQDVRFWLLKRRKR